MMLSHTSVLVAPIVNALVEPFIQRTAESEAAWLVDCTLGGGGHTQAFLEAFAADPRLTRHRILAVDQDPREGKHVHVTVTPEPKGENGGGLIGVAPATTRREPVAISDALSISIVRPAEVVYRLVIGLGRIVTGKEKASLTGPVGISREIGKAAHRGLDDYLYILALLSAYLGGFNLLPIPALDGGRLMFLVYEGVARRKPNARIEAQIHAIGLLMFLALMVVVSVFDIRGE